MCAVRIRYEKYTDYPAVRDLCLNCDKASCDGICDDFKNTVRDIIGYRHLNERPAKVGVEGFRIRQKHEKRKYQHCKQHAVNGISHTLSEWSEISGVPYNTLYMRMYRYGMTLGEAMGDPLCPIMNNPISITVGGETLTVRDWARRLGVQPSCIYSRMRRGYTPEQSVTMERANKGGAKWGK